MHILFHICWLSLTSNLQHTLTGHSAKVYTAKFLDDGVKIVSGCFILDLSADSIEQSGASMSGLSSHRLPVAKIRPSSFGTSDRENVSEKERCGVFAIQITAVVCFMG